MQNIPNNKGVEPQLEEKRKQNRIRSKNSDERKFQLNLSSIVYFLSHNYSIYIRKYDRRTIKKTLYKFTIVMILNEKK